MTRSVLSKDEYNLLLILQSNPTIKNTEIAKELDVSNPTVTRKINKLKQKRLFTGIYAQYQPLKLGLIRHVFIFYLRHSSQFQIIERILDKHPYTVHRSRIYSPFLAIYSQFHYPEGNPTLLYEFINRLEELDIITNSSRYISTGIENSLSLSLESMSVDELQWSYDWNELYNKYQKAEPTSPNITYHSLLDEMQYEDFEILRILTHTQSNLKQRDICKKLGYDRTKVWRRFHFLEDNILTGYKASINRKFFNITSNKIILLHFQDNKDLYKTFNLLTDEEIRPPFRYFLEIITDELNDKRLLLYISLPQYHDAQLFYFLNDISTDIQVYNIDTIGDHAVRYAFYEKNFNPETKNWIVNRDYVVEDPINNALSELNLEKGTKSN